MVILNRTLISFIKSVREKFNKMNSDRQFDVNQASSALAGGFSGDIGGHQDALVDAFQTQICLEGGAGFHGNERFTEVVGNDDVDVALVHRSRAVDDVANVNLVRGLLELDHKGKFYAPPGVPEARPIRRSADEVSDIGNTRALARWMAREPCRTA